MFKRRNPTNCYFKMFFIFINQFPKYNPKQNGCIYIGSRCTGGVCIFSRLSHWTLLPSPSRRTLPKAIDNLHKCGSFRAFSLQDEVLLDGQPAPSVGRFYLNFAKRACRFQIELLNMINNLIKKKILCERLFSKISTGVCWLEVNKCAFTFSSEIRQIQCMRTEFWCVQCPRPAGPSALDKHQIQASALDLSYFTSKSKCKFIKTWSQISLRFNCQSVKKLISGQN